MVREPDAPCSLGLKTIKLMSKHRVLSFNPQLRLEWRGYDGQSKTEQPDHSASLGDSITSSTRIGFSVHTGSDLEPPARPIRPNQGTPVTCSTRSRAQQMKSRLQARVPTGYSARMLCRRQISSTAAILLRALTWSIGAKTIEFSASRTTASSRPKTVSARSAGSGSSSYESM
jgi:hypothetical protein